MRVLLLGSNERAAYSIAKSLTKINYTVDVLNDKWHALKYSRFVNFFHIINASFEKATEKAASELIEYIQSNNYDYLIPVNDTALMICVLFKKQISMFTAIAFVNEEETHKFCVDKSELLRLCDDLQLPSPRTIHIKTLEDINKLENINYPCIAKPVSSKVYKDGKIFSHTVKKIKNREALIDFIREKIETVPVMVQEVLSNGYGVGYNFLAQNGQVLNAYAHQRINEAWGGGQSTYRKTIDASVCNIEEISKKIIKHINWTGIAMLEFLVVNNTAYIMEINGRAWGSIELGIFAGCDLPKDMITAIFESKSIEPYIFTQSYYSRNLTNEIVWISKTRSVLKFTKWFFSLRQSFKSNQIIEDSVFRDPVFRTAYFMNLYLQIFKKVGFNIRKKLTWLHIPTIAGKDFVKDKKIALICKGNINRSAFAEFYCKNKYPGYNIQSFGTIFKEHRLSPENAILAAKKYDVNLNLHRSKYLTDKDINDSDIFIIMDNDNYWELKKMKVPVKKIFKLSTTDISDPYGFKADYFDVIFKKIATSIDAF